MSSMTQEPMIEQPPVAETGVAGHNVPGHSMVEVAQDAWARGFSVTVVNAAEKAAVMHEWSKRPLNGTNPDHIDIIKWYEKQSPDYRVGLFLMNPNNPKFRGDPAFAPFVWDVDMPGEIARMKKETGVKVMPPPLWCRHVRRPLRISVTSSFYIHRRRLNRSVSTRMSRTSQSPPRLIRGFGKFIPTSPTSKALVVGRTSLPPVPHDSMMAFSTTTR